MQHIRTNATCFEMLYVQMSLKLSQKVANAYDKGGAELTETQNEK